MEIKQKLFDIPFPIEIFNKEKIDLNNKKLRKKIFERNMHYYLYDNKQNSLLEKRRKLFNDLAKEVGNFVMKEIPSAKILNISIFGSSLYSTNNNDFDFLVILKGNLFENIKTEFKLNKKRYFIGISIKGEENFAKGVLNSNKLFSKDMQNKIIQRTTISLPIRHLPLEGLDFQENKKIFLENCYAQAYDLLINAYELFYCKNKKRKISQKRRAQKLLSRIYEASKYISYISPSVKIERLKKRILRLKSEDINLRKSKKIFEEFVEFYNMSVNNS